MGTIEKICSQAISEEELISIRREFHMHPAVSLHETPTMERIAAYLDQWDIPYRKGVADTGIVAHMDGNRPGKNIALRADIDALPITEKNPDLPYRSQNPGVMHACGHDAHITILLGAAKTIRSLNGDFPGSFTFFFQPDEEDTGGAKRMIAEGCLENPHIDHVIGLHVVPDFPAGQIGVKYGKMYAASDMITLKFYGKSCHGAQPQNGVDAIAIAAQTISTLQTIVSRNTDPTTAVTITIGKIHGGEARNQVAEYVECAGIIRTLDPDSRRITLERVERICAMVAESMGGRAEVETVHSYGPLITDTAVTDVVCAVAREQLGEQNIVMEPCPQLTVEDFSYYAMERPSGFYHLGCCREDKKDIPLHNSSFDLDEACLMIGVQLQVDIAMRLAEGK